MKQPPLRSLVLVPLLGGVVYIGNMLANPRPGDGVAVTGTVTFTGAVPDPESVDVSTDAYCAGAHPGGVVETRPVHVGADGGLQNVIVYVKDGLPEGAYPETGDAAVLDQQGCVYQPAVVTLRVDQALVIRNSDATMHNVHVFAEANRSFNIGQPIQGMESRRTFQTPELGIRVRCDIHGWMSSSIAVFQHPFHAVTSEDGTFSLANLPAGEYVIEAWHATLGTRTERVTVDAGGSAHVSFAF